MNDVIELPNDLGKNLVKWVTGEIEKRKERGDYLDLAFKCSVHLSGAFVFILLLNLHHYKMMSMDYLKDEEKVICHFKLDIDKLIEKE